MLDPLGPAAAVTAPAPPSPAPAAARPAADATAGGAAAIGPASTVAPSAGPDAAPVADEGPAPLRLSVDRADDGVFVYTLTDPQTGALVAVIPRDEVSEAHGAGRTVDRKV